MQKVCKIAHALQKKFPADIISSGRMPDKHGNIVYYFSRGDIKGEQYFMAVMKYSLRDINELAKKVYLDFGGGNGNQKSHASRKSKQV